MVPHLRQWFCGTQACFGGHLTRWPEFQALGVYSAGSGGPIIVTPSEEIVDPDKVSYYLFGFDDMFYPKPSYMTCSDHQCVVDRLESGIRELEQLIRDEN